jgi:hypothetical protein
MYTRKTALALAIQARTCPPQPILDHPAHARHTSLHLAVCPFCSTRPSPELEACRHLSRSMEKQIHQKPGPHSIEPGQIWRIDPALAQWRDQFYYFPPAVVVIQTPKPDTPGLLAAQIWHDIYLAGPGDLVVTPEDTPVDEPVFIETWNLYTLDPSFLTHYLGRIPAGTTADILKMNENPAFLPSDAIALLPLEENDPRHYFRKMEIEVGYTFARTAAQNLMQTPAMDLVTELKTQIRHLIPGATFSWPPKTVEECFAVLEFPTESLALAAADQDQEKITATHLRLAPDPEDPLVTSITPFYCVIHNETGNDEPYTVNGSLADLHFDLEKTRFSCYLADSQNQTLEKGIIRIDPESHAFIATFVRSKTLSESLCIVAEERQSGDR